MRFCRLRKQWVGSATLAIALVSMHMELVSRSACTNCLAAFVSTGIGSSATTIPEGTTKS